MSIATSRELDRFIARFARDASQAVCGGMGICYDEISTVVTVEAKTLSAQVLWGRVVAYREQIELRGLPASCSDRIQKRLSANLQRAFKPFEAAYDEVEACHL